MQKNSLAIAENRADLRLEPSHPITLDDIENAIVQRGVDLWMEARGSKSMPSRMQLSPRVLSPILRNTVLVRVISGGEDFELRIIGDAVVQAEGRSLQGMTTAEIDLVLPGYGEVLRKGYAWAQRKAEPGAYRGWYDREADERTMYHETAVLPLSDDDKTVDHILVVGAYIVQTGPNHT
ncbi:MAG TPA: hypothetical protein VG309_00985 [Rhizomicrobium sp.]|jgi:hypothetical protein|nr:hypothetical protein [Rhizomicrobium sp.]